MDDLINLRHHIQSSGFICHREWFMTFVDGKLDFVGEYIPQTYIDTHPDCVIKHPDLIFKFLGEWIIVEVDGKAHDHYVTKTQERNMIYLKAGLRVICLNKEYLKYENMSITEGFEYGFKRLLENKVILSQD